MLKSAEEAEAQRSQISTQPGHCQELRLPICSRTASEEQFQLNGQSSLKPPIRKPELAICKPLPSPREIFRLQALRSLFLRELGETNSNP